jgi:hypothetical protein
MSEDKILYFPGAYPPVQQEEDEGPEDVPSDDALIEKRNKALGIIVQGAPFLLIGLRPTDTGSDVFTVIQGDPEEWRKIRSHLDDIIDRAYAREGL